MAAKVCGRLNMGRMCPFLHLAVVICQPCLERYRRPQSPGCLFGMHLSALCSAQHMAWTVSLCSGMACLSMIMQRGDSHALVCFAEHYQVPCACSFHVPSIACQQAACLPMLPLSRAAPLPQQRASGARDMTTTADPCNTVTDSEVTVRVALSCRTFSVCSGIQTTLWAWEWGR